LVDEEPIALSDPVMAAQAPAGEPGDDVADGEIEWVDEAAAGHASELEESARFHQRLRSTDPAELAAEEIREVNGLATEPKVEEPPGRPKPKARPGTQPATAKAADRRPVAARPVAPDAAAPPEIVPGLMDRLRRHRNALVFLGVALVVAATVALRVRRARLQELPGIAERGRTEGLTALDEGRFDVAWQLLADARRAVDELGDQVEGASAIRQGAREAEVIVRRASASLEEMLDEARRADPKEWAEKFDRLYKGSTAIFDVEVREVPDAQGRGRYGLDYRVLPSGEGDRPPAVGLIDTRGFKMIEERSPKVGDHLLFGATLASFRFDVEQGVWLVGLGPESGVPLTHAKALEALGWPSEADDRGKDDQP
jgi:hypothetical protein